MVMNDNEPRSAVNTVWIQSMWSLSLLMTFSSVFS